MLIKMEIASTSSVKPLMKATVVSARSSRCFLSIGIGRATASRSCCIRSSLKHQKRREKSTEDSPLRTTEEIATRFGFDAAVADLERLFLKPSSGDPPPSPAADCGRPVRVAYQGVRGSYCHEAAVKAFPKAAGSQSFPCACMEDAFTALEDLAADRALIPAENSVDGPIHRNLDLLLRHHVSIVGEIVLPVDHCLLALPFAPRSGIRRIVSHPQALSHCRRRLDALGLEICEVSCAAEAARIVSEGRIADTAVIGSKIAAREFGLQVVEHGFQDGGVGGNFNRFLQLALGPAAPPAAGTRSSKTTVAFSLKKGVSDLYRAMWAFESRGIRVGRVDHRPNRSDPNPVRVFDYAFIVDVEGSAADPGVEAAVASLNEIAGFVRVLGSYVSTCQQ